MPQTPTKSSGDHDSERNSVPQLDVTSCIQLARSPMPQTPTKSSGDHDSEHNSVPQEVYIPEVTFKAPVSIINYLYFLVVLM